MENGRDLKIVPSQHPTCEKEEGRSSSNEDSSEPSSDEARKFHDLHFRPKLKARKRPKRPQRQLCSFNKGTVDREGEGTEDTRRGRKRHMPTNAAATKKRQHLSKPINDAPHSCPVCA